MSKNLKTGEFAEAAAAALRKLKQGNARFARGEARFPTVCKETLALLAKAQKPFATILGCSDSRVPPELLFDANFGELFIVRVAGNVTSPEIMATLQYAGAHLRTPLFLVLGHEECGAVKAALHHKLEGTRLRSRIQLLVDNILPGLPDFPSSLSDKDKLNRAIESNVRWSMRQISKTSEWQNASRLGARLEGAVFGIATGRVRFLDGGD